MALALGGRTIAEWKKSMSQAEFQSWLEFSRRYPYDDFSRIYRPAALMSATKGFSVKEALDWLLPPEIPEGIDEIGLSVIKALNIPARK